MIILSVICGLGWVGFIFSIWYSANAIKKLQFMSDTFETLDIELQAFDKHLKTIYELEMFYGDPELESLIKHSKHVLTSFEEVRKDYEIFNGDIDEEDFFDEEDIKEEARKDEATKNRKVK